MSSDKVIEFLDLISEYIESNINPSLKNYNTPTTSKEAYIRLTLENHKKVLEEIKDILLLEL